MKRERIQPVTRTYNTLMIACNTSNQWQASSWEAFRAAPSTDGSSAAAVCSSAHPSANLHCPRPLPIQWAPQEALRVYEEMAACRHQPNTTTYNALISGGRAFSSPAAQPNSCVPQPGWMVAVNSCSLAAHSR